MDKIFLILLVSIFVLGGMNAAGLAQICIDLDPPSLLNSSLTLTATNDNINLNWIAATDTPDCSGIDYYDIFKRDNGLNFSFLAKTSDTTYTDTTLSYDNTYDYMIHVFDLAGHNEGEEALSNSLFLSSPSVPTPSGGGGGSSSSYWECGEWSACINETQTRICENVNGLRADRVETNECFSEFIPLEEDETPTETEETQSIPSGFFAAITGAVVGTLGTGGTVAIVVIIIAIVGLVVLFIVRKREYQNP